ncbi:MAG: tRNA threonylcarbamoyladenosine dehydratase [Clostridia bacterium]|nr:tRNA threonylcarbamoyladenosine dehydratase [Clostridia bacterium]
MNPFIRSELLLGESSTEKLRNSKVIVFGVGGVGSYTVEALARSGIGHITLVDNDDVAESNINRQLIATVSSVGQSKVEVARKRILDINPDCQVTALKELVTKDNTDMFSLSDYDYIVDAIDTVSAKIALAVEADAKGIPMISSMGTGNKLDGTQFEVSDIYKTSVCPLARVMRYELKKRGVKKLKVVYSKEEPLTPAPAETENSSRRQTPGSVPFVPGVAGLIIAGEVIKDLIR